MTQDRHTILRHAGTVLVGQLAVMAFGITDTVVAGRHSEASLAALSVGSAIYITVYVALMGLFQALLPVWAELRGAHRFSEIGPSVHQAVWLAIGLSVPGMALLWWPDWALRLADVPQAMQPAVKDYLRVLALALPSALLFRIYGTLNQALAMPRWVTSLQIGGLILKVPLSAALTFGVASIPAFGVVGCAWATLVVNHAMLAAAIWTLRNSQAHANLALWRKMALPNWQAQRRFMQLGGPAALAVLVEVSSFTWMALFIANMGATASAAHQIAANVAAVLYMVPLSLAIATSARVSYWLGAGNGVAARDAAGAGLRLATAAGLGLAALAWVGASTLASVYTHNAAVAALAAALLSWVALYHLADAVQTVCVFVLRCFRVTIGPLVLYTSLLWGVGLGGGLLASRAPFSPWADSPGPWLYWAASAGALWLVAACVLIMLRQQLR
ncbi:MATE family efflux transporter, partial [Acidovorax lacteus]